jgi:crossover junction endodeoxyribonuclease RusA
LLSKVDLSRYRQAARARPNGRPPWPPQLARSLRPPLNHNNIRIRITFYFNILPDFDTDNMSKPICDALIGVAYSDDSQLCERIARRKDINGSYRIRGINPELAVAIAEGNDFVFIEIEQVRPDEEHLL